MPLHNKSIMRYRIVGRFSFELMTCVCLVEKIKVFALAAKSVSGWQCNISYFFFFFLNKWIHFFQSCSNPIPVWIVKQTCLCAISIMQMRLKFLMQWHFGYKMCCGGKKVDNETSIFSEKREKQITSHLFLRTLNHST